MINDILKYNGLIVSCQAAPGDPLYGDGMMAKMALAAEQAGAIAIRACGVNDLEQIKMTVQLPLIGLTKRDIPSSPIYITPELSDVKEILATGAHIVALDMTNRANRLDEVVPLIDYIHLQGALVMADISTFDEGIKAEQLGADCVSTTLSGYTPYSPQLAGPDLKLVERLSRHCNIPVIAEGRISSPIEARQAIESGAYCVVVGSAITRPQWIVRQFIEKIS